LTGAGGAIGIHVFAHIMENTDWHVVMTDSFRHKGYYDRLTTMCREHEDWDYSRFEVVNHDLTTPITEREIDKIGKINYIINLASLSDVQDSIDNPVPFVRNNIDIMLNMLEYARVAKPEAFIQFSTDEVYGPDEKDGSGHPEWDTILPSNPYAASKAGQEALCISYWRSYGVPVVITNTMNNVSEMQSPSKYPAMIQTRLERGEKVTVHSSDDGSIGSRYYIHSKVAADAVLYIINNTKPYMHQPGHIDRPDRYNIVGDAQLDNLELAQLIARMMGKKFDYELVNFHKKQPGHDLNYGLNGEKMEKLGWKHPRKFADTLQDVIDWQCDHPEWLR
jgi:dTDP-glucose 4,6-dehydratase